MNSNERSRCWGSLGSRCCPILRHTWNGCSASPARNPASTARASHGSDRSRPSSTKPAFELATSSRRGPGSPNHADAHPPASIQASISRPNTSNDAAPRRSSTTVRYRPAHSESRPRVASSNGRLASDGPDNRTRDPNTSTRPTVISPPTGTDPCSQTITRHGPDTA